MRAALILFSGLVCLAGFYFAFNQNQGLLIEAPPRTETGNTAGEKFGAVVLERDGAQGFRLEFKTGRWTLAAPAQGPADKEVVKALLETASGDQALVVVKEADPEEFGFQTPYARLTLLGPDREIVVREIRIGHLDADQKGRYVNIAGQASARLLDLGRIAALTPEPLALRDKAVLEAVPGEPGEVALKGPGEGFSLIRTKEGWQIKAPGEAGDSDGRADPFAVRDLLEGIYKARVREFVRTTPPDQEARTLRLVYEDRTQWLRIWPDKAEDGLVYGRSSFQPGAFSVPARFFNLAVASAQGFLDQRALAYDPAKAGRLTLIRETGDGPLSLVVEKSPHGVWRVTRPDRNGSPRVDQARASALVLELARIRNMGPARGGFEKPALTIRVESGKGELMAGLEVGISPGGRILGRALPPDSGREKYFELEPKGFQGLPGPWALTNKN